MVRDFNGASRNLFSNIEEGSMSNFEEAVSGEVIESEGGELVVFKKKTVVQALESGGELDFLMTDLEKKVEEFNHDMSTGVSRARSASLSGKVSSFKVEIAKIGAATVKEKDDTVKAMKKSINKFKDKCDELRDKAKEPLTEWRAEDARLKAVEAERIEAEKLLATFNNDHEMGLLLDDKWNRDMHDFAVKAAKELSERLIKAEQEAKELAAKQTAERIERDARIAQEAAAKAIKESLDKAEREAQLVRIDRFNSDHEIALLTNNSMIAAAEKIATEERAKAQEEEAEKRRIEAAEQAKRDAIQAAENARLAEIKRQEDEAARVKAEDDAREKDRQHVNSIKAETVASVMTCMECNINDAVKFVDAVADKQIPNITIKY